MNWELVAEGLRRPEAPCPAGNEALWCSDIFGAGEVMHVGFDGTTTRLCERAHVGGIVPHADGGLVVSGHDLAIVSRDGEQRSVHAPASIWGFNDITTDRRGYVFAGRHEEAPSTSLPERDPSLWRLGPGGDAVFCYGDLTMNNGLRMSPEGDRLYHADTLRNVIWVSDIGEDGMPRDRRVHYELAVGMPDGMAIDELGCLWVAAIGGAAIVRVTPTGELDAVLDVPRAYVSAVAFAGGDRRELVATAFGGEPYDPANSGCVLRLHVEVAGLALTPARL